MNYPLKHISIRVPWHDTGWDSRSTWIGAQPSCAVAVPGLRWEKMSSMPPPPPKLVQSDRRGFFARLLGLAALPFATKGAAAFPATVPRALSGARSIIDENDALDRARAWVKGLGRVEPCVPTAYVYDHDPAEYFFFSLDRGEWRVGGDEIIAVRKTDGRVSYGGFVGE